MTSYFARVVLHRVDGTDDYPELHAEMKELGFAQVIRDTGVSNTVGDKGLYKLPGGLYFFDWKESDNSSRKYASAQEAYDKVSEAVKRVTANDQVYVRDANNPPSVLITQAGDVSWSGLKKQPAPKPKP